MESNPKVLHFVKSAWVLGIQTDNTVLLLPATYQAPAIAGVFYCLDIPNSTLYERLQLGTIGIRSRSRAHSAKHNPRSPLPPDPRRQQLVAVLAVEQLGRHCQQPSRRVPRSGDVLGMGSVQRLQHQHARQATFPCSGRFRRPWQRLVQRGPRRIALGDQAANVATPLAFTVRVPSAKLKIPPFDPPIFSNSLTVMETSPETMLLPLMV